MTHLILIPAFGCSAALYAPQVEALGSEVTCQVHVPDAGSFDAMVQALLAQAPARFVVLGTSMGGRLALETALAAPERVQGLAVIGAGAGAVADRAAGERRSARIRAGEKDQVLQEMAAIISHLPGPQGPATRDAFVAMGRQMDEAQLARQSDALAHRVDRWPQLGGLTCPVLALWGAQDQFSPAADGMRLAAAVEHGRYVEIADCGHFPTLEYPDDSTAALAHWLRDGRFI